VELVGTDRLPVTNEAARHGLINPTVYQLFVVLTGANVTLPCLIGSVDRKPTG